MPPSPSPEEPEIFRFLRAQSAFQTLDDNQLKVLAEHARKMPVASGTEIIRQGERGEDCFILEEGEVEVLQSGEAGTRRVALLGPGSIIGEAALLADVPRNATVRSTKQTELYAIAGSALSQVLDHALGLRGTFFELFSLRDRPRQREGVSVHQRDDGAKTSNLVLKNRQAGRYFSLSREGFFVWQLLDGRHDLRDLTLKYFEAFKQFAPHTIATLLAGLSHSGFIHSRTADALGTKKWGKARGWHRLAEWAKKILEWRIVIRQVDPWVTRIYRGGIRHLFTKPAQILMGLGAASGLLLFFLAGAASRSVLASGAVSAATYLYLIPAFLLSAIFHEAGHAFATKAFGREVHSIGFGWYWFGPIFYVDTSDMWVAPKWPRIAVSAAGAYADLLTAAVASTAAFFIADPALSTTFWMFALASYILVLGNLNPLMEFDGYYVLADLLERPNLRGSCLGWFRTAFPKIWTRPTIVRGHLTELVYGLFSILYLGLMVIQASFFYSTFLHQWTSRWIPEAYTFWIAAGFGLFVAFLSLLGVIAELTGEKRAGTSMNLD